MNAAKLSELYAELSVRLTAQERELQTVRAALTKAETGLADAHRDNAVLRSRLDDHLKRVDTWAGRAWTLVTILIGAVLSLAAGLVAALARK